MKRSSFLVLVYIFCSECVGFCAEQAPTPSLKQTALKFLLAMLGVAISSVSIYLGLTIYNKFFLKKLDAKNQTFENTLETPKNVKEAVNTFLDKTNWKL